MKERRRHIRRYEENRIKVMTIPEDSASWYGVVTCLYHTDDISRNGLSFHTYEPVPKESFMRIDVTVTDTGQTLQLAGVVRRTEQADEFGRFKIGVEILDQPPEAKQTWVDYVDDHANF